MAPHASETAAEDIDKLERLVAPQAAPRTYEIIYFNVITFTYWHVSGLFGLYQCFTCAKWATIGFNYVWYMLGELGVIGGAHRLWSHRTYKAKMPLQILLMILNSIGFQNTATDWIRNHRVHHKYSDTDADPHNATRGFFFSHVGWLLTRKHPEVIRRGKLIDMSDIYGNPVLRFQKNVDNWEKNPSSPSVDNIPLVIRCGQLGIKFPFVHIVDYRDSQLSTPLVFRYAIPLIGSLCFVLPTLVPVYFWGEDLLVSLNICLLRYCCNLHSTFLVNSAAHLYGNKPYDRNIMPRQNTLTSIMSLGEGFHNYHHAFSWDYRAAELGNNWLNVTTWFIDFFAWIGWAYDLKSVPDDVIKRRMARSGDGTNLWGWGEKDMTKEQMDAAEIRYPEVK